MTFLLLCGTPTTLAQADCNRNGRPDGEEITSGFSADCDANGIPDACEFASLPFGFTGASFPLAGSQNQVAADFDGDGRIDLALGHRNSRTKVSSITVLLNDAGDGSLIFRETPYATPDDLSSLVAKDFDGDGDVDLVTAHSTVALLHPNRGDGSFLPPLSVPVPPRTRLATTVDVTGDGRADLIATNTGAGTVSVLPQSDTGGHGPAETVFTVDRPIDLAHGDLDGDGDLDLVVAAQGEQTLAIHLRVGARFQPAVGYETPGTATSVTLGDLDGDADLDVVLDLQTRIATFENTGDGSLEPPNLYQIASRSLVVSDLDADGDLDIAAGSVGLRLLVNDGQGRFGIHFLPSPDLDFLNAGDVDGDGDSDLLLASLESGNLRVAWNGRTDAWRLRADRVPVDAPVHWALLEDVNSDGHLDVVTVNGWELDISVLLGRGDATFLEPVRFPIDAEGHWNYLEAWDFDGDGDLDIAAADGRNNRLGVLFGDGRGGFRAAGTYEVGTGSWKLAAGDLDGDGLPDLVSANSSANSVSVLRNQGDGVFAAREDLAVGAGPFGVTVGDLDGDGDADIASANQVASDISILWNDGEAAFAATTTVPLLRKPNHIVDVDLDGDGALDLVTASISGQSVTVLRNRGNRTFEVFNRDGVPGPISVIVADVTGDDILDFLTASPEGQSVAILAGDASGNPSAPVEFAVRDLPRVLLPGDLDGDGDVDFVTSNRVSFDLSVLRNEPIVEADAVGVVEPLCDRGVFFRRGDVGADGRRNIADVLAIVSFLFRQGRVPPCQSAADVDDDGHLRVVDAIRLLTYVLGRSGALPEPFATCGADPTEDTLSCLEYGPCP